jgi:hypothetical protein
MESLKHTVQSLVAAKKDVVKLEARFLRQLSRLAPNGQPGRPGLPRRLKCPKCTRRFALPLHLGRHFAMTHKQKLRSSAKASR